VPERSPGWYDELRGCLQSHPHVAVGEIGLDRWIESHDLQDQTKVFTTQLDLAVELDRPVTIHCLHAWGALWKIAQQRPLPGRGFLLHAYGGSPEMVAGFAERGAYFSFSPYFLHQRKGAQRAAFQRVPLDRLLVETDAPDMRPPDDQNPRSLKTDDGSAINHPANIDIAYAALAEVRQMPLEELVGKVAGNFERLFRR
jgi:TatD DNase family protein